MIDDLPPLPEWFAKASPQLHNDVRNYARAAIEKDRERQGVPNGWKLVPIEPTDEWIARLESQQTGALEAVDADAIRQCIFELLAAAPQPQPVQQEQCPECDGTGTVAGSQAHFPCPLCTSPQAAQPLSDERLCEAMRKASDELLDHIYEFSTISEGVNPRLLAVGRSIEQAHGITKGTT